MLKAPSLEHNQYLSKLAATRKTSIPKVLWLCDLTWDSKWTFPRALPHTHTQKNSNLLEIPKLPKAVIWVETNKSKGLKASPGELESHRERWKAPTCYWSSRRLHTCSRLVKTLERPPSLTAGWPSGPVHLESQRSGCSAFKLPQVWMCTSDIVALVRYYCFDAWKIKQILPKKRPLSQNTKDKQGKIFATHFIYKKMFSPHIYKPPRKRPTDPMDW